MVSELPVTTPTRPIVAAPCRTCKGEGIVHGTVRRTCEFTHGGYDDHEEAPCPEPGCLHAARIAAEHLAAFGMGPRLQFDF